MQLRKRQALYLHTRFAMEWILCLSALLLLLPALIVLALVIAVESKGHPIFIQKRPGKGGRLFKMYKFRSMYHRVDQQFQLTVDNDPRVTKIGKFLREYHIDELPQLFNVLKGDMSLIGPRPLPAELYESYKKRIQHYDQRHIIRPGMTGFAQVWLGYTNTLQGEAMRWHYDMHYIRNFSFTMDVLLLFQTLFLSFQLRDKFLPQTLNMLLHKQSPHLFALDNQGEKLPSSLHNILMAS